MDNASFLRLESMVKQRHDHLYWSSDSGESSSDIEMTSYALLTYLHRGEFAKSLSIVKWLISKSNSLGAYSSTQNTILALQSLSQFGLGFMTANENYTFNIDINIVAKHTKLSAESTEKSFNVNEKNSFILQTWYLPSCYFDLSVQANGSGIAALQAIFNYNLKNESQSPQQGSFIIEQTWLDSTDSSSRINVHTCVQYEDSRENETGMSIVESSLFSGFEVSRLEMDSLLASQNKTNLKMIEILKGSRVAFYMQKLDAVKYCFDWSMTRSYPVSKSFFKFCSHL